MEGEQPQPASSSPPPDSPQAGESTLRRANKRLRNALAGLSLFFVAFGSATAGDATDFLKLGSPPAAESSQDRRADNGRAVLDVAQLTDQDLTDQRDDDPSDPGCIDQIRADAGLGSLIEFVGESGAPFPNAHTEYYRATTTSGELHYACTIVLPNQITLARLGARPVTGADRPPLSRDSAPATGQAPGRS